MRYIIHDGRLTPAPGEATKSLIEAAHPENNDEIRDWISNGWQTSLSYYMASLGNHPVSTSDICKKQNILHLNTYSGVAKVLYNRRTIRSYTHGNEQLANESLHAIIRWYEDIFCELIEEAEEAWTVYVIEYETNANSADIGILRSRKDGVSIQSCGLDTGNGLRIPIKEVLCNMQSPLSARATIVIVGNLKTLSRMYPYERALREQYTQMGRITQHLILHLYSANEGALITPATNDNAIASILNLKEFEAPLYTVTFGGAH